MKTMERTPAQDRLLFDELDNYSKHTRMAARNLREAFGKIQHRPKSIDVLCKTLSLLEKSPIEDLDDVITNLNKHAQEATVEFGKLAGKKNSGVEISQEQIEDIFVRFDKLSDELFLFLRKANDLNKK